VQSLRKYKPKLMKLLKLPFEKLLLPLSKLFRTPRIIFNFTKKITYTEAVYSSKNYMFLILE